MSIAFTYTRRAFAALTLSVLAGCVASSGTSAPTTPSPVVNPSQSGPWRVGTAEHVDLWLHGFAMLTADTARVPFFERGYRERMKQLRTGRNLYTNLDANADRLSARFAANPSLVNAQFVAMYFESWDELNQIVGLFVQSNGDPRAVTDPNAAALFNVLAASFPTGADRDWLRLFTSSLNDERTRFYHQYWVGEQQNRAAVRTAVDSLWRNTYRAKLRAFLERTQQLDGTLLLSLPLDGEGRTINLSKQQNAIAVEFPATAADALDAIYVLAHEAVSSTAATAVTDNTTPAEQRNGVAGGYMANATVRGGAILLQRTAPELVAGYMRHYLRAVNASVPNGDPASAFAAAFPISDTIRDAITRQVDTVMGGI